MPKEVFQCISLSLVLIDSIFKMVKNCYPQVFLEECKYVVGLFRVRFEVRGGGGVTPCLKPVRITPETSKLARKYTYICSFKKYTF